MIPEYGEYILIFPGSFILIEGEAETDITDTVKRGPVTDWALGCCRLKTISLSDDPVCHKSTVGSSGHSHASGINLGITLQCFIDKSHDVTEITSTIITSDIGKRVIAAVRTTRIGIYDYIAMWQPVLHLVEIDITVSCLGAAMNIQHGREAVLFSFSCCRRQ